MSDLINTVPALCAWMFDNATVSISIVIVFLLIYTIGYVRGATIR